MQSKSLLCVVYDELVLTHEYARERVGNTYHRGNTYPREGEQISLLIHQGEHISPRAWLEISVRGNTYLRYSGVRLHNRFLYINYDNFVSVHSIAKSIRKFLSINRLF